MEGKMMKIGLLVCLWILLWLPASILALDKPAAGEAKKVVDYYHQGKGQGAWFGAPRDADEQALIGGQQVEPKSVKTPGLLPSLEQAGAQLQGCQAIRSRLRLNRALFSPSRAVMAASQPAWPPPTTITSKDLVGAVVKFMAS